MQRIILLLSAVMLISCQSFGPSPTSEWAELDHVAKVKCAKWPLGEKDLGMNQIALMRSEPLGFLASGRLRDSSVVHYFAPFDNSPELEVEDLRRVNLGRGALVLGSARLAGKSFLGVAQRSKAGMVLELRGFDDNVVRYSLPGLPPEIVGGAIVNTPGGFWLTLKESEQRSTIQFVKKEGNSAKLKAVRFANQSFRVMPAVLPMLDQPEALVMLYDAAAAGKGAKDIFLVQRLTQDGTADKPRRLEVPIDVEIESYASTVHNGRFYVAYVDGDSMVGQAKFRVAEFGLEHASAKVLWNQALSLNDVHVSEPLWLTGPSGPYAVILKWVDEESTLATYKVDGSTVRAPTSSGIFSKGARLVDTFSATDGDSYAIIRSRENDRWSFQICYLKGI